MKSRRLIDTTVHGLLESFDLKAEHPGGPNNNHSISFSNWQWRPLVNLCRRVSAIEVLDIDFSGWHYNDGERVDDDTSKSLARSLRKYSHRFISNGRLCLVPKSVPEKQRNLYSLEVSDLETFITFLETCEGFSIW